jgi:uncharacterized RDD family membrane protein YckC
MFIGKPAHTAKGIFVEKTAGLMPRLIAFVADMIILGAVGLALGAIAFDSLAALGPWGRLIGLAIGVAYFGLQDSRIGNGQTLGKRLMRIAVAGLDGQPLSPARSSGRFLLIWAPILLNGLPLHIETLASPVTYLLALGIFGLGGVLLYLAAVSRKTGRALQDRVFASVVLIRPKNQPVHGEALVAKPLANLHRYVCALLILLSLLLPLAMSKLSRMPVYQRMTAIQTAVSQLDGVRYAAVAVADGGKTVAAGTVKVQINARSRQMMAPERLADVARTVHRVEPGAPIIQVTVAYGYDIGIADRWISSGQQFKAAELTAAAPLPPPAAKP